MEEMMINDYARQLMDAHGQRAIAEAAQRAANLNGTRTTTRRRPGGASSRR